MVVLSLKLPEVEREVDAEIVMDEEAVLLGELDSVVLADIVFVEVLVDDTDTVALLVCVVEGEVFSQSNVPAVTLLIISLTVSAVVPQDVK